MFLFEREDLEITVGFALLYMDEMFRTLCTKVLTMARDFSFFPSYVSILSRVSRTCFSVQQKMVTSKLQTKCVNTAKVIYVNKHINCHKYFPLELKIPFQHR